jgi:hypothetical protein
LYKLVPLLLLLPLLLLSPEVNLVFSEESFESWVVLETYPVCVPLLLLVEVSLPLPVTVPVVLVVVVPLLLLVVVPLLPAVVVPLLLPAVVVPLLLLLLGFVGLAPPRPRPTYCPEVPLVIATS